MRVEMKNRQPRIPLRHSLHNRISNGMIPAERNRALSRINQSANASLNRSERI
jgi:hypothetical protein